MSEVGFTTPLFWRRLGQIWFGLMAVLFLLVLASNAVGKTCQDLTQPAEARLASCNRAWWLGLPRWPLESDRGLAALWFFYGAAYADLGRVAEAEASYKQSRRGLRLRLPATLPDDLAYADESAQYLLGLAAALPKDRPARLVLEDVLDEGR